MTAASSAENSGWLHVVAAVVVDHAGRILITRRHDHLHQGGLWEFPGGKVEAGESVPAALSRELAEELGIAVRAARPLIRVPHAYPDRRVLLDVWRVDRFDGEARGMEGQPLQWVPPAELDHYAFPAANHPIVTAARLPSVYLITPEPGSAAEWPEFLRRLELLLANGIRLVQLRSKQLPVPELLALAQQAATVCRAAGATLLVNCAPEQQAQLPPGVGLHLASSQLHGLIGRPAASERLLCVSCHTAEELAQAQRIGADFVVLSPVKATATHPDAAPIGWEGLRALTEQSVMPVYALGGMRPEDRSLSWAHGAQGIAAIRGIWDATTTRWD